MLCCDAMASDVALGIGGRAGNFELNRFTALIAESFLPCVRWLADGKAGLEASHAGITRHEVRRSQSGLAAAEFVPLGRCRRPWLAAVGREADPGRAVPAG